MILYMYTSRHVYTLDLEWHKQVVCPYKSINPVHCQQHATRAFAEWNVLPICI